MRRGFRKICTQIELRHDLAGPTRAPEDAAIHSRANLPAAAIDAHARNFRTDRFALDVMLSQSDHDRLFARWIRNSLEGGRHSVSLRDLSFVTFREEGSDAKIDLVSVLNKGRGVGTDLMNAVLCEARARRKTCVKVVTECENPPAIGLYMKVGFRPFRYYSCLHLVRG
jgi:GNAT superfamily N-acetyltransferase